MDLDPSKKFIFFREDVDCPETHRVVQMSKDVLEICGKALEKENLLGEDSTWFWKLCGLQGQNLKKLEQ